MNSLLKSNFELTGRRALLINADRVTLYGWHGGELAAPLVFPANDAGLEQFARYLRETAPAPIYVLVDVVEEEYRQDTIPHVFGADRRSVLERKQSRLFRGTNYCHALVQGREKDGRRDDRVLLTALIKPTLVTPWIDRIAQYKVPLAGIYSLPLLGRQLLKRIGATGQNVLLITLQSASGLRQTFFRDQQFKISRLASMPRLGTVPFGAYLMGELDKLRRYLNSIALVATDAPLDIYILSHGEYLTELEKHCNDSPDERYFLVDVAEVGRQLGVGNNMSLPYSDELFAWLLLAGTPRNHYARPAETRYFRLHQSRLGLLATSAALVIGALLVSGLAAIEGLSYRLQGLDAQQKAAFYQTRYEIARRNLPPTPVEPRAIKTAVDIVSTLERYRTTPLMTFQVLSAGLEGVGQVQIDQIDWIQSHNPNASEIPATRGAGQPVIAPVNADARYFYYQIARVRGHIAPFSGDQRQAIAAVDALATRLRAVPDVHAVQVLQMPVDASSTARLAGDAGEQADSVEARFTLRIVLGVADGNG